MKTKNRNKGTVMMFIGFLLLAAALFLTVYNIYDAKRAENASQAVLPALQESMKKEGEKVAEYEDDAGTDLFVDADREMPVVEVDGEKYVGILEIPDINLSLPILKEWSYKGLRIAPCLYEGSVYKDNMVIAGHNYARHFSPIKKLPVGTEVIFVDAENHIFQYEIGWTEVLNGTEVEEMITGDWDMTLFTCTYGGEARYAVRCFKK